MALNERRRSGGYPEVDFLRELQSEKMASSVLRRPPDYIHPERLLLNRRHEVADLHREPKKQDLGHRLLKLHLFSFAEFAPTLPCGFGRSRRVAYGNIQIGCQTAAEKHTRCCRHRISLEIVMLLLLFITIDVLLQYTDALHF